MTKKERKTKENKKNQYATLPRRCLANNLPALISAAGLREFGALTPGGAFGEEARKRAKSSLYLPS